MDDDFLLFYLIEGAPERSYISVSYNSNGRPVTVDDLRKSIFQHDCQDIVRNHKKLTLLKVSVLFAAISAVKLIPLMSPRSM
jgi:hypothetical protein